MQRGETRSHSAAKAETPPPSKIYRSFLRCCDPQEHKDVPWSRLCSIHTC